jgi:translocation and assembly module TamB
MKRAMLFLLILVMLFAVAAGFLLATERGLHWALAGAARVLPGKLTVETASGRIIGPLEVAGLQYETDEASVSLDAFIFDWKPRALLSGRLRTTEVTAQGLTVRVKPPEAKPSPKAPSEIRFPLEIILENVSLRDVSIYPSDADSPFVVEALDADATVGPRKARIRDLHVKMPELRVRVAGDIEPRKDYPMDLRVEWSAEPPGVSPLHGEGEVRGTVKQLEVLQHLSGPGEATLRATAENLLSEPAWQGALVVTEMSLQKLQTTWPGVNVAGRITGEGKGAGMVFQGSLSLSENRYGSALVDFALQSKDGGWDISKLIVSRPEEESRIEVSGNYRVEAGEDRFDLAGRWQALQWPPTGQDAHVRSSAGDFSVRGTLGAYALEVETAVGGRQIPQGRWTLSGSGSRTALVLDTIQAALLNGELSGSGEVRWRPELSWSVQIDGNSLDPGQHWLQWPGRLALTASASGKGTARKSLSVQRLEGVLRGHPFQVGGSLDLNGQHYTVSGVALRSGSAELKASGSVKERLDLSWEIDAADLSDLLPQGQGSLRGSGKVTGARKAPRISAALQGTGIAVQAYRVGALEAELDLDLEERVASHLRVNADTLVLAGRSMERLQLNGTGSASAHRLNLNAVSDEAAFNMAVAGGYGNGQWSGVVEDVRLAAVRLGVWELAEPGGVNVARDAIATEDLCWVNDPSKVCLQADWHRSRDGRARMVLARLPLAVFQSGLPPTLEPDGYLDGEADVTYTAERVLRGSAVLRTDGGALTYTAGWERPLVLRFDVGTLNLQVDAADLHADLTLSLADGGAVAGALRIAPFTPLDLANGKKLLSGSLRGEMRELGWVPAFLPALTDVQGVVRSDLALAGTMERPTVRGTVAVDGARADVPTLGIRFEEIRLEAASREERSMAVEGQATSGGGQVTLIGEVDLAPQAGFPATLALSGEKVEIVNLPEARVLASPDLRIRFEREGIGVSGKVVVPWARIEPADLSGGVPLSRDVVIVTEDAGEVTAPRRRVVSRVRLTLGEEVAFSGFGLTGRIMGSVSVVDTPEKLTTGQGELQIIDGKYKAYGQNLEITRGRLLFTGGPIDDPGLDVRAVRHTGELESGVDVRGTLQEPRMELFSSPSLDQTDALSYLVLGRSSEQVSGDEGQMLYDAALSLGLTGGGLLAQQIGSTFGIEDIEIERGTAAEDATVFIGKYLSPRLYVSYGIGLFDPVSTFRMRYQLSSKWLVQTEYGFESGGDLIYRIERD